MKASRFIILMFLALLLVPFIPARASDAYEHYWEWYSDNTKTEVVGWRYEQCGGIVDAEGYQTAYSERWTYARCEDPYLGGETYGVCAYTYYLNGTYYPFAVCPAYCSYCV